MMISLSWIHALLLTVMTFFIVIIPSIFIAIFLEERWVKILKIIWGIVLIVAFLLGGIGNGGLMTKGDYSNQSCEGDFACRNPPIYKVSTHEGFHVDYFCEEHHDEAILECKNHGPIYKINSNSSVSTDAVKCKVCGRSFEPGTPGFSSVRRTNMCNNCYDNYKWGEQFIGK